MRTQPLISVEVHVTINILPQLCLAMCEKLMHRPAIHSETAYGNHPELPGQANGAST